MKSTEIELTVKRSTMDQTIESEHDFFLSDTNESMFFHTLVSDEFVMPQMPSTLNTGTKHCAPSSSGLTSTMTVPSPVRPRGLVRQSTAEKWFVQPTEIRLNPYNVDRATSEIKIHSTSPCRQLFNIESNCRRALMIEPECGVINAGLFATVTVTIRNVPLPNEPLFIRIRVDKKQEIEVPVIIDRPDMSGHLLK